MSWLAFAVLPLIVTTVWSPILRVRTSPFFGVMVTSSFETFETFPCTHWSPCAASPDPPAEPIALEPVSDEPAVPDEPPCPLFSGAEPIVSDEPPEPIAPPPSDPGGFDGSAEPAPIEPLDPLGLEPIDPLESLEPDPIEPAPLEPALDDPLSDEPAAASTTVVSCEPLEPVVWADASGEAAFCSLHMAPVWSFDCAPEVLHAIPTTSGSADAILRIDMGLLLGARSWALRGRGATPAAEPSDRASGGGPRYTREMARLVLTLVLAALATGGCRRPAGPAEAYRAFAAAARAGDADGVWARLSSRSREVLDARAREIAARAPAGLLPPSGKELVIGELSAEAPRLRAATVLRESRDAAVLSVEVEGAPGAREVSLVQEAGVWRVVLPFDN